MGAAEAEELVATLTARARKRGRLRGLIVGFALDRARQLAGLRELPKYYFILTLARLRRELALVGAELAARRALAAPDDVFFLTLRETRMAVGGEDMRDLVRQRREEYAHETRRKHVPRVLLSDGTEPELQLVAVVHPAPIGVARGSCLHGAGAMRHPEVSGKLLTHGK